MDYSSLPRRITLSNISTYARKYEGAGFGAVIKDFSFIALGLLGLIVFACALTVFYGDTVEWRYVATMTLLAESVLWAIGIIFFWVWFHQRRVKAVVERFVRANGLRYVQGKSALEARGLYSSADLEPIEVYGFENDDKSFKAGNLMCTVGFSLYRGLRPYYQKHLTYVRLSLDRKAPHLIFNSRRNDMRMMGYGLSNLPGLAAGGQRISLEGNFDEYFTTYRADDYDIDALTVLTPDLMHAMIDQAADFDIEMVDKSVYFYTRRPLDLTDPRQMARLFELESSIGAAIKGRVSKYRNDRTPYVLASTPRTITWHYRPIIFMLCVIFLVIFFFIFVQ